MKHRTLAAAAAALLAIGYAGYAWSQASYPIAVLPTQSTVGPNDLLRLVPGGSPSSPDHFIKPGQVAGAPIYQNLGVATSGNTYAFNPGQVNMIMQPSGTLAAVTLTAEASPSDGQMECFTSTQTTTSLTWNANTGQSISGAPTAGVANTQACMVWVANKSTWYRLR